MRHLTALALAALLSLAACDSAGSPEDLADIEGLYAAGGITPAGGPGVDATLYIDVVEGGISTGGDFYFVIEPARGGGLNRINGTGFYSEGSVRLAFGDDAALSYNQLTGEATRSRVSLTAANGDVYEFRRTSGTSS